MSQSARGRGRRPPPLTPPTSSRGRLAVLTSLLVIVSAWALWTVLAPGEQRGTKLSAPPLTEVGTWVTNAPVYASRMIEVNAQHIVIGRGREAPPLVGTISSTHSWREGDRDVIHIDYTADGEESSLEMVLEGSDSMRLRHPSNVVWTRQ